MKPKILLALDGSEPSMKAAHYVANLLGNRTDVSVTLFHVLSPIPSSLLESSGYEIPSTLWEAEFKRRKASWEQSQQAFESELFEQVREVFKGAGFRDEQIQTKYVVRRSESDAAHEILKECEEGDYDTVVMGKRGLSRIRTFLTGRVTEKVVRHAKGRAVWVIE